MAALPPLACKRSQPPARMKGVEIELDVERSVAGGLPDFDAFFRSQFERVARAAALVARDGSVGPDLAQEAFARLFERWGAMESADRARNFVYKVAINLARSHVRKHLPLFLYGLRRSDGGKTTDDTVRSDDWLSVAGALGALPPRQRACVVLVDYVDLDSAGAADVLGMAPSTVRVHLARGRAALRASLGMKGMGEQR